MARRQRARYMATQATITHHPQNRLRASTLDRTADLPIAVRLNHWSRTIFQSADSKLMRDSREYRLIEACRRKRP
eukprot:scaffold165249_cov39-Tisochrysis_lutea.AAC.3